MDLVCTICFKHYLANFSYNSVLAIYCGNHQLHNFQLKARQLNTPNLPAGYKSEEITILTTYNGQKHLIRDVVKQRCGDNPVFGFPKTITTVDRYQGSQNNYILLSLVRTKTVGHLRDVRRLIVAMSRARLGLYVFARVGKSICFN